MPILFIVILSTYLLGNIYVFVRGLQALSHSSTVIRIIYSVVFWLCVLSLFATIIFRNVKNVPFTVGHYLFLLGASWLVFILYMIVLLALTDLIKFINHNFTYGFTCSLVLTFSMLVYGFINYQHPVKQVINIVINNTFTDCNDITVVAFSDLHLGYGTDKALLHKNIDRINAEHPDLILIGGDLIDNSLSPVENEQMERELNRLNAPMGIYLVPGNHEYISNLRDCKRFISEKTKITFLCDSLIMLSCGLQILGRDDRSNRKRMRTEEWVRIIDASKPLIIMDHQPSELESAHKMNAVLQFSGHTHYGQVIPLKWLTKRLFEIPYGYEKRGDINYYVSSGLALWGPPFRIGTNSEFVVFNIKVNSTF